MTPLTQVAEISVNYYPAPNWKTQPKILKSFDAYVAAKLMDIVLADHLIITPLEGKYYSFADEADLFTFNN